MDGGESLWLLLEGMSSTTGNNEGAMGGIVVVVVPATAIAADDALLLLLPLHQTASVLRGDKNDGCWSFASPYCHKSCGRGLEGKQANRPFVERGVAGVGHDGMLGKPQGRPHSGIVSNRGEYQRGEECLRRWLLLQGETSMGDNNSSGSLLSSKGLARRLVVGRLCGSSTNTSSSSSNNRSNLEVNAGRASSNSRQPDMLCCVLEWLQL